MSESKNHALAYSARIFPFSFTCDALLKEKEKKVLVSTPRYANIIGNSMLGHAADEKIWPISGATFNDDDKTRSVHRIADKHRE